MSKCRCPKIDTAQYDGKSEDWENKCFYFHPINNLMHKPMGLEEKRIALKKEIIERRYDFIDDKMVLCEWTPFKGRIMMNIKKPEKYDENFFIFDQGEVYSFVFKGKSSKLKQEISDRCSQMELEHSLPAQKVWVWHLHCKECAKAKDNLAVIFIKT
ncbi:hypothetical protein ISS30_04465 [bacterium]|nr:hypothetical protein [bacterium]